MTENDAPHLFGLLDDVWTIKGTALLTGRQKALWFALLADLQFEDVKAALMAHVKTPGKGTWLPMPSDVIAYVQGDDGRPGPEEAWALAFKAVDERNTVVWTSEAAESFAIASPILQAGDEVGARMAFKEAYTRLIGEAREQRAPTRWQASIGDDSEQRDRVLLPHVQAGRISADELKRPELATLALSGAPAMPALGLDSLLALPAPEGASAEALACRERARQAMAATKQELEARAAAPSPAAMAAQIDRERVAMLKAESAGKLRDYIESQPERKHGTV